MAKYRIVRHIHGTYDGPPDRCTECAAHPLTKCYRCNGLTSNPALCGFCFMPPLRLADKITGRRGGLL